MFQKIEHEGVRSPKFLHKVSELSIKILEDF